MPTRKIIKNIIKVSLLVMAVFFAGYLVFTWTQMRGGG